MPNNIVIDMEIATGILKETLAIIAIIIAIIGTFILFIWFMDYIGLFVFIGIFLIILCISCAVVEYNKRVERKNIQTN